MPSVDDLAPLLQGGVVAGVVAASAYSVRLLITVVLKAIDTRATASADAVQVYKQALEAETKRAEAAEARAAFLRKQLNGHLKESE